MFVKGRKGGREKERKGRGGKECEEVKKEGEGRGGRRETGKD